MAVVLLAGPPAVGHNTIAELFCQAQARSALVDVDMVRSMLTKPYAPPWSALEGKRQYRLGVRNACALATSFAKDGCTVALLDVAPPNQLQLYRDELSSVQLITVLLFADPEILIARDLARDPNLTPDPKSLAFWHRRIRYLAKLLLANQDKYQYVFDTGKHSPLEAVKFLCNLTKETNNQ